MSTRTLNDLEPMRYQLETDPNGRPRQVGVYLERVLKRDGTEIWAIRHREGYCFSRDDRWFDEPQPSERTDHYLYLCRFSNPQEALNTWDNSKTRHRYIAGEPFQFEDYDEEEERAVQP